MKKPKILIVEDTFDYYDGLVEFFEEKGFEIIRDKSDEDSFVNSAAVARKLCKSQVPDIALLDIDLKNDEEDGIDLGIWLHERFGIPLVYLTEKGDTYGNVQRLSSLPNIGFYTKASTDDKMRDLWMTIQLLLVQSKKDTSKAKGLWVPDRPIALSYLNDNSNSLYKYNEEFGNYRDKQRLIFFSEIIKVEKVPHERWNKNNVVILLANEDNAYLYNSALSAMDELLPWEFIKINASEIVNGAFMEKRRTSQEGQFFIRGEMYTVSRDFSGRDLGLLKLKKLFLEMERDGME